MNPDPNPVKDEELLLLSGDSALLAEGGVDSATVGQGEIPNNDTPTPADTTPAPDVTPAKPEPKKVEAPKPAPKPAPKAVEPAPKTVAKPAAVKVAVAAKKVASSASSSGSGLSNPCPACHLSQGIHGHNGVDLAGPEGTPIYAAASGSVTTIKGGDAWNGGYGNYVVITHPNGTSTLYAHMVSIATSYGPVSRGEVIGYVGRTGEATGNHLHFEVHGAVNPFGY